MKVLKAHDRYGWITAVIEERWCQAKVYNEPSTFGVKHGRVSKLAIGNWKPYPNWSCNATLHLQDSRLLSGILDHC